MYKKITHTIVEEHFDHPMASQIKKSMNRSRITTDEVFLESKFRSDVRAYFESLQNDFSSMIKSIGGTDEELITSFENLFKDHKIDNLGNMTKPLYSSEFGERINEAMRIYAIVIFLTVQMTKYGKDTSFAPGRLTYANNELSQALTDFNRSWNYQNINTLLSTLSNELLKKIKATKAKDAGAEAEAARNIVQLFSTFESQLVNGIIAQYPERFAKTELLPSSYNSSKDIM